MSRRRRWMFWLLGIAAFLIVLIALVGVFLPPILTALPLDRVGGRYASAMLSGGQIHMVGHHLSWEEPVGVRELRLSTASGDEFLTIKNLRTTQGIVALAKEDGRSGVLLMDSLSLHLKRDAAGRINYEDFLPKPTGAAAEPAEPFVLDLATLLKPIALPVSSAGVVIQNLSIRFDDAATTGVKTVLWEAKDASLTWRGGDVALHGRVVGVLTIDGKPQEMGIAIELTDLFKGGMIDPSQMTANLKFGVGAPSTGAIAVEVNAATTPNEIEIKAAVNLEPLGLVLAQFPQMEGREVPTGTLRSTMRMNTSDAMHADVMMDLDSDTLRVQSGGEEFVLPPLEMEARTRIDKRTLAPRGMSAAIGSEFLQMRVEEFDPESSYPGADQQVMADLSLQVAPLLAFLRETIPPSLLSTPLPFVDGDLQWKIDGYLKDGVLVEGISFVDWKGRTVELPESVVFPEGFTAKSRMLKVEPLDFQWHAHVRPSVDYKAALVSTSVMTASGLLAMEADWKADGATSATLSVKGELGPLMAWTNEHFTMASPLNLSGDVTLELQAVTQPNLATAKGRFSGKDLVVESPLIPTGVYTDSPEFSFTSSTNIDSFVYPTTADIRLDSWPMKLSAGVTTNEDGSLSGAIDAFIAVGDIQREWFPLAIDPAIASTDGTVRLTMRAESDGDGVYTLQSEVASQPDFLFTSALYGLELRSASGAIGANANIREDAMDLNLDSFEIQMEEVLTFRMTGKTQSVGDAWHFQAKPSLLLDIGVALEKGAVYLEDQFAMAMAGSGSAALGIEAEGAFVLTPLGIGYPEPVALKIDLEHQLPAFMFESPDGQMVMEGYADRHVYTTAIDPTSATMTLLSGSSQLAFDMFAMDDSLIVEKFMLQTEGTLDADFLGKWNVGKLEAGRIVYTKDGSSYTLPPMHGTLAMERPTESAAAFDVALSGDDLFTFTTKFSADTATRKGKLEMKLEGLLQGLLLAESGDLMEQSLDDLAGKITATAQGEFAWNEAADGTKSLGEYTGSMEMGWEDVLLALKDSYAFRGFKGSLNASAYEGNVSAGGLIGTSEVTLAGERMPMLEDWTLGGFADLNPTGRLSIGDLALRSERMGIGLSFRGIMEDIYTLMAAKAELKPEESPLPLIFNTPAQFFLEYDQDLSRLESAVPGAKGDGKIGFIARLENIPEYQTVLTMTADSENAAIDWNEMAGFKGLNGSLPINKVLFHQSDVYTQTPPDRGQFQLSEVTYQYPPYRMVGNNGALSVVFLNDSFRATFQSQNFLGATMDSTMRLRVDGADPMFEVDFSMTGFDGAMIYPDLARRKEAKRGFDAFGVFRLRLRENGSVYGVLDDMILRMELVNVGPELVREMIRTADPEGANASTQTTLTALQVASPTRMLMDLRGGLITANVDLASPTGMKYTLPILDRSNLAGMLESYVDESMNPMVLLTRGMLLLLLSEDLDDLTRFLTPEVSQ